MKAPSCFTFEVNGLAIQAEYYPETVENVLVPLLNRMADLHSRLNRRTIVFLAAPPAAGKSTLSQFLQYLSETREGLAPIEAIGLDGFHYHSDYIKGHQAVVNGKEVPMQAIKGAPETFDLEKLTAKLSDLKESDVLWPVYDRKRHDVVEDCQRVTGEIILLEGNWLLLDEPGWRDLADFCDLSILITATPDQLVHRLIGRKVAGGLAETEAAAFVRNSDVPNILRVLEGSRCPDITLKLTNNNDYQLIEEKK